MSRFGGWRTRVFCLHTSNLQGQLVVAVLGASSKLKARATRLWSRVRHITTPLRLLPSKRLQVTNKKRLTTTATDKQVSPPQLARFLLGVLTPKDIKESLDFIADFDELYVTRIVPEWGKLAPWWVWSQIAKTAVYMAWKAVLEFRERGNKRAN